jgi:hypothetical protein
MLTTITYDPILKTKNPNKFDVETDEKARTEEDAKTQQKAEYVPIPITCDPILKIKIPNRFDEKDRAEEDAKTQQKAEYVPISITCKPLLKIKIKNKFDEVSIDWDSTEEFDVVQQNAVNTALTDFNYLRDDHTVS